MSLSTTLFIIFIIGSLLVAFIKWVIEVIASWRKCEHGVWGGKEHSCCKTCVADDLRIKKEQETLQQIATKAKQLREEERARLILVKLKRVDYLIALEPRQFEKHVADMYRKLGYSVELTPCVNDGGRDAIARKNERVVLIECKKYNTDSPVGRPALQKFYAAMMEDKADAGYFVTTSYFSKPALEYSIGKNIELVDGNILSELMSNAYPSAGHDETFKVMCTICGEILIFDSRDRCADKICTKGHNVHEDLHLNLFPSEKIHIKCPRCGRDMRSKRGLYGYFMGCSGYPHCKYTTPKSQWWGRR